jgi:hypothetical protein
MAFQTRQSERLALKQAVSKERRSERLALKQALSQTGIGERVKKVPTKGSEVSKKQRYRFYETPFWPKTYRISFHPQVWYTFPLYGF